MADSRENQLDKGLPCEVIMTRLIDGDDAFVADDEITSELSAIGRTCAAGGG